MAAQGRARRPAARVRRRHPCPAGGRGGHPRRPGARRPGAAVDVAGPAAGPHRPGGHGRDRAGRCGVGRRPGDHQPAARPPARDARRLPRCRRAREARAPGARLLRPRSGPRPADGPRGVAQQRLPSTAVLGPRHTAGLRPRQRPCDARCRGGGRPGVGRPRAARRVDHRVPGARFRRGLPAPRRQGAARVPGRVRRARAAAAGRLRARAGGGAGVRITDTSDLWWKTAVIYCLDVETFLDWNGDGCGDFAGLTQRIDHLADLGVSCLWLMPFYPTAERDDGYDITDFYGVDPRLGTHGDLVEVIRTANDRGIRVIADLVVNHTSAKHPWFRSAESSNDSPYRDFYVWRSDPPPDTRKEVVFPDQETGVWQLSEKTGEWYLHRFYREQPDLNVTNPLVRDEIAKVMGFWLQLGLSGFRVDAVPFLLETEGEDARDLPDPHGFLRSLRALVGRRSGNGVLLGEVNLPHEQQAQFFGGTDGDELTMQFDFIGMQALYLSLARADAAPLATALTGPPPGPGPSRAARRSRRTASGPRSCATTTSSRSTSSPTRSGPRCSPRSGPRSGCRSSAGDCAAGCRRCCPATHGGSAWYTACCSRCLARRCSSTARRSAWGRSSPLRDRSPCGRRCSGPAAGSAAFPCPRPAA